MNATDEAKAKAIKLATGQLVARLGGIEAAAGLLDRGKSTVHRWTDRNDDEHFVNVRDAVRLQELSSAPLLTELLCKFAGGLFVPHLDPGADEGTPEFHDGAGLAMQLAQRLGQVSGEIAGALADDGRIDAAEAERVLDRLDEHDRVSARLRQSLRAVIRGEG